MHFCFLSNSGSIDNDEFFSKLFFEDYRLVKTASEIGFLRNEAKRQNIKTTKATLMSREND
jgi:hypothetical protein